MGLDGGNIALALGRRDGEGDVTASAVGRGARVTASGRVERVVGGCGAA
jgi:hypothetical protein